MSVTMLAQVLSAGRQDGDFLWLNRTTVAEPCRYVARAHVQGLIGRLGCPLGCSRS